MEDRQKAIVYNMIHSLTVGVEYLEWSQHNESIILLYVEGLVIVDGGESSLDSTPVSDSHWERDEEFLPKRDINPTSETQHVSPTKSLTYQRA
jgi:hypothetical protein